MTNKLKLDIILGIITGAAVSFAAGFYVASAIAANVVMEAGK